MKQFYRWVALQCEKHNDKLTYIDHEESWTPIDFICSIILSLLILVPLLVISAMTDHIAVTIIGCICTVGIVFWHFWHLMKY